jgi:DNA-binding response OmpR family regulator
MTEKASTIQPKNLVLLVVDDEVLIADLVADQLGDLGYSVAGPAYTLEDGKRLARDAAIDGALIDVHLGRGGLSTPIAEILKERKIPFLFASGFNDAPDKRFRDIAILTKPFSMDRLNAAVGRMLAPAKG